MTSVTVVIGNPISTYSYVNYYSVTAIRSIVLVVQRPVGSSYVRKQHSVTLGYGKVITPFRISTSSRIPTLQNVLHTFGVFVPLPQITTLNNIRESSAVNTSQVLPTPRNNDPESHIAVAELISSGGSLDGLPEGSRQIIAKTVTPNVKSSKEVSVVISTLANNYGAKSNPRQITTSYSNRIRRS